MQYLQNQTQKNNSRFTPAFQALNKNADGFVCSINTQQHDITKSRIESRLEFYKNQKQGASGMAGGMFNQQQQQQQQTLGGGSMFGGGLGTGGQATGGLGGGLGSTLGGGLGGGLGGAGLGASLGTGLGVGLGGGLGGGTGGGLGGLGTGQTSTFGGGLGLGQTLSQPNPTGGLLGQSGGFGTTSTSLLGGGGTSNLLGGQQPASQPLFGAAAQQSTGLFGQSAQQASQGSAPQQQGLSFQSAQFGQAAPQLAQQQAPQLAVAQPQQIVYTQNFEITTQIQYDQEYEKEKLEELEEDFKNRFPTYSQAAYQKGINYGNQKQQKIRKVEVSVKPKYPKMYTWKQVELPAEPERFESQIQPKIEKVEILEKVNPNAPTCKNYECTPSIDQLKYYTDEQLQQINDFVLENDTGKIKFLDYVDLRNLDLDELINLGQDSVEFYPESSTRPVPQKGKEINVRCHVTFKNFACNNKKMNELRIKNRREFEKRVYLWGEKCSMKIISISDDVTVQLEEI